jgi:hypothetical protein
VTGPKFLSSELAERWLVKHQAEEHPHTLSSLQQKLVTSGLPVMDVKRGGEVALRYPRDMYADDPYMALR